MVYFKYSLLLTIDQCDDVTDENAKEKVKNLSEILATAQLDDKTSAAITRPLETVNIYILLKKIYRCEVRYILVKPF